MISAVVKGEAGSTTRCGFVQMMSFTGRCGFVHMMSFIGISAVVKGEGWFDDKIVAFYK